MQHKIRITAFSVFAIALVIVTLGAKLSHNQTMTTVGYDALKSARNNTSLSRDDVRSSLKTIIRRREEALSMMQGRDIRLVFGNPQQVRRDDDIHVWQYRTENCLIDIYMRKADDKKSNLQAAHHDIRKRRLIKVNNTGTDVNARGSLTEKQRRRCLRTVLRRNDPDQGEQSYASLE